MSIISVLFLAIAGYLVFTDFARYWYFAAGALLPVVIIWFVSFRARRRAMAQYRQADEQRQSDSEHERLAQNAEALRQATRQQIANDAAAQQRAAQPAPTPAVTEEPFEVPDSQNGFVLAYSYPDVGFYVPDDLRDAAKAVPPHEQLTFYFDEENAYDSDAVGIKYGEQPIGYMYNGKLRDWIAKTADDESQTTLGVSMPWDDKPILGLYFYLSAEAYAQRMKKRPGYKEVTLVGNAGNAAQEIIEMCHEGERIDVDYEDDRDSYIAYIDGESIGLFPSSAEEYLSEHPDVEARILRITERDSGKLAVKVMMAFCE